MTWYRWRLDQTFTWGLVLVHFQKYWLTHGGLYRDLHGLLHKKNDFGPKLQIQKIKSYFSSQIEISIPLGNMQKSRMVGHFGVGHEG